MKKFSLIISNIILILGMSILLSCATPSPFIGTWADNNGNTITFGAENEFNASIKNSANDLISYTGTYTIIQNALFIQSESVNILSEWDIRGAMLYLDWTDTDKVSQKLTLYKIKN